MVPNLGNLIFPWNFWVNQIQWWWFQIWQYYFQIPAQNYPDQSFLVPIRIFIFHQTLQQDKFEDFDFKHDKNIFKFQPKFQCKLGIFGPKFKDFYFAPNVAIRQIRGLWFQIRILFRILFRKTQIKQFLS